MKAHRFFSLSLLTMLLLATVALVSADSNYDEATDGDLSGDRNAPTAIALSAGANRIAATSISGDREYYTVSVPAGMQIAAIMLENYVSTDNVAFVGVQEGTIFTEPSSGTDVSNLLGWTHFNSGQLNTDILDEIGQGGGAIGFTGALTSSNYVFWTQQTGNAMTDWQFNIVVNAIYTSQLHDEAEGGDFSNENLEPTTFVVGPGAHSISGVTQRDSSGTVDLDYVTIIVECGAQLDAILLSNYISTDDVAFMAIQSGNTFTETPAAPNVGNMLGWLHMGAAFEGSNMMDDLGMASGAIGFSGSLPAGAYSFWIQQTGMAETEYQIDFITSADPSPNCLYLPLVTRN